MKYWLLCILLLSNTSYGNQTFAAYFEYELSFMPQHADDITRYFTSNNNLSAQKQILLFKSYNEAINKQIKANPNKAVLWFIKGLNFKNRLQALEQKKVLGAKNILPIINQTVDYIRKSFNKAISLDQVKKKKLTAKMYGTMTHNLINDDRITALQNELSLGGSGDNESQYWFSHWNIIGSLQDEGRFEDAEKALYNMQKELKSAGLEDGKFKQIYQKAKINLSQKHALSEKNKPQTDTELSKNKLNNQISLFENLKIKFETYWVMVLFNAIVIISLIVAFIKREKN